MWRQSYDNREHRQVGQLKVYESDKFVIIECREGANRFYAILNRQGQNITDEQIAQIGMKRYASMNPKVLLTHFIHTVRLAALAAAVSGGILLVCELRKAKERAVKIRNE